MDLDQLIGIFAYVDDDHPHINHKEMNKSKLLIGIIAGTAAGAALGILLAPNKGSSTRKRIADGSDSLVHKLGDKVGNIVDGIANQFLSTKNKVQNTVDNGKSKVYEQESKFADGVKKMV